MLVKEPWLHLGSPSHTIVTSPLGDLTLVRKAEDLVGLYFSRHRPAPEQSSIGIASDDGFVEFETQLGEYFAGSRRHFALSHVTQGTDQRQRVWDLVSRIPYGETTTYGRLARELDDDTTAKEVGAAVARNLLCVVVPCHRVVGADGGLTATPEVWIVSDTCSI